MANFAPSTKLFYSTDRCLTTTVIYLVRRTDYSDAKKRQSPLLRHSTNIMHLEINWTVTISRHHETT